MHSDGEDGTGAKNGAGMDVVRAGFLPLIDSAPLIVAARRGMAAEHGIRLELRRQPSWASVRDRINVDQLDVAQMLAGMPIASSLGIAQVTVPTIAPFAFGYGGNAIILGRSLFGDLAQSGIAWRDGSRSAGHALAHVVRKRKAAGRPPLVLAMVFPFSSHNYELRYWLAASGIAPDRDVRLVVIPPPMMVDSLRAGQIDGFCAGEPWGSLAVDSGTAAIVATKTDIWARAPEKVLGLKAEWSAHNPGLLRRLLQSLNAAAQWCEDDGNHDDLARLLADDAHVAAPERILRRALSGKLVMHPDGTVGDLPSFLTFGGNGLNRPEPDAAVWIASQMVRWGQVELSEHVLEQARLAYAPDIYLDALQPGTAAQRAADSPFMDGIAFDPGDIAGYLRQLSHGAA